MALLRKKPGSSETSSTWWVFVSLSIFYFLFRWNLIYSVSTTGPCGSITEYWLVSDGHFPGAYYLFLLTFILFATWSVVEMLCAITADKEDKSVAIAVNPLITAFLCYLFYGFSKQWEFFEIQRDIWRYNEMLAKPKAYSYEARELFKDFLTEKFCRGEIEHLYPDSRDEYKSLYSEFIEEGRVRPTSPPEWY